MNIVSGDSSVRTTWFSKEGTVLLVALVGCLVFQHKATAANDRGQSLFKLCRSCHGTTGEGRQNLQAPAIAGLPEWYLVNTLNKFRDGGRGSHPGDYAGLKMRPIARMLRYEGDVEAIAKYVSNIKPGKPPQTITDGDATSGAEKFAVCIACHGADGKGMQPMNAPPLVGQSDWYLFAQLNNFKHGRRGANVEKDATGATMAPMANMLPDDQSMKDVLAHIYTLQ
ncbi:MAG: c-type cytochrome [Bdellovibrionaceae bacterium]|nr:c-type cytochrome [Bdellovibrionales bacterium]MCB9082698.1 c-type cytochrome [Pseudobdellovibrionaceae bacterium]